MIDIFLNISLVFIQVVGFFCIVRVAIESSGFVRFISLIGIGIVLSMVWKSGVPI